MPDHCWQLASITWVPCIRGHIASDKTDKQRTAVQSGAAHEGRACPEVARRSHGGGPRVCHTMPPDSRLSLNFRSSGIVTIKYLLVACYFRQKACMVLAGSMQQQIGGLWL